MAFQTISNKQWKQLIQYQLNGQPYGTQQPLALWNEVNVLPFYSPELQIETISFNLQKKYTKTYPSLFDYITHFSATGNFLMGNQEKDIQRWGEQYAQRQQIWINASIFSYAGANAIQEIAYTYGILFQYLLNIKTPPKEVIISLDFSPHIHFEIAKIKAFRILWNNISNFKNTKLTLMVKHSQRYCSNIMLKNWAMQGMLLSEADLILTEDSPLENLSINNGIFFTDISEQMVRRSLQILKEIEKSGGYLAMLRKHIIQRKITEKRNEYKKLFGLKERFSSPVTKKRTLIEPILGYEVF